MGRHDRLPAPLRRFLIHAALPWSAESALRLWQRALARTGCEAAALARLAEAEARTLAREGREVWGAGHPGPGAPRAAPLTRRKG
jgi:hypothetical protein